MTPAASEWFDSRPASGSFATPPPEGPREHRAFAFTANRRPVIPGYDILGELGRGGMGIVYQARQFALDRVVALKVITAGGPPDELAKRLEAEARIGARLRHPNIVRVYDAGAADGRPFLAMECVTGGSLAALLAGGPLPFAAAAALTRLLARAIDVAHRHGVIHRDLKPGNVLLETGEAADPVHAVELTLNGQSSRVTPKISDFGLAKLVGSDSNLTRTAAVLGTPSYMAPEQASGTGTAIGPAADVYALGAILYEALTGRPPFSGATALETLDRVRTADPVPPDHHRAGVPRNLQTICLKCLEKAPTRRYATAAAVAEDLERYLDGRPILARPVSSLEVLGRWIRRRPTAAALAFTGLTAVGAAVIGLIVHNARMQDSIDQIEAQAREARRQKSVALATVVKGHQALDDIFVSLDNPPVGLADQPAFRQLYEGQARTILRFYADILADGDATDPEMRFARGMVRVYAGRMNLRLRNFEAAERDFLEAIELLEPAAAPDAPAAHRREWAQCRYWYASLLQQRLRTAEAAAAFESARALFAELIEAGAADERDRRTLALCRTRLAQTAAARDRWDEALGHARAAVVIWDGLIADDPANDVYRTWRATALQDQADAWFRSGRLEPLEALASDAAAGIAWYSAYPPERLAGIHGLCEYAEVLRYDAQRLAARGELRAAVDRLSAAVAAGETARRLSPTTALVAIVLTRTHHNRAVMRAAAGDPTPDIDADWAAVVAHAAADAAPGFRIERASAWLTRGETTRAIEELRAVAAADRLTGFQAAALSLAFARAADADAAITWARRAVERENFPTRAAFHQFATDVPFHALRVTAAVTEQLDAIERTLPDRRQLTHTPPR